MQVRSPRRALFQLEDLPTAGDLPVVNKPEDWAQYLKYCPLCSKHCGLCSACASGGRRHLLLTYAMQVTNVPATCCELAMLLGHGKVHMAQTFHNHPAFSVLVLAVPCTQAVRLPKQAWPRYSLTALSCLSCDSACRRSPQDLPLQQSQGRMYDM